MDTAPAPPFVDEQRTLVRAPGAAVWARLLTEIPRFAGAEKVAGVLGARPGRFSGGPLTRGSTLPGFEVVDVAPERLLRLAGRHRFARYELVLGLEPRDGGTLVSARTYAEFPGLHGAAYRAMVIGSGAHHFVVARLLRRVRQGAQR